MWVGLTRAAVALTFLAASPFSGALVILVPTFLALASGNLTTCGPGMYESKTCRGAPRAGSRGGKRTAEALNNDITFHFVSYSKTSTGTPDTELHALQRTSSGVFDSMPFGTLKTWMWSSTVRMTSPSAKLEPPLNVPSM